VEPGCPVAMEASDAVDSLAAFAEVTVTSAVPFMPGAPETVAVMLCFPNVIKVTPFVKVWEPASLAVKEYPPGSIAAGSELVKCMALLIIVSRLAPTMAVTVMVKGEFAATLGGAVI
jgi:hypothetical protein